MNQRLGKFYRDVSTQQTHSEASAEDIATALETSSEAGAEENATAHWRIRQASDGSKKKDHREEEGGMLETHSEISAEDDATASWRIRQATGGLKKKVHREEKRAMLETHSEFVPRWMPIPGRARARIAEKNDAPEDDNEPFRIPNSEGGARRAGRRSPNTADSYLASLTDPNSGEMASNQPTIIAEDGPRPVMDMAGTRQLSAARQIWQDMGSQEDKKARWQVRNPLAGLKLARAPQPLDSAGLYDDWSTLASQSQSQSQLLGDVSSLASNSTELDGAEIVHEIVQRRKLRRKLRKLFPLFPLTRGDLVKVDKGEFAEHRAGALQKFEGVCSSVAKASQNCLKSCITVEAAEACVLSGSADVLVQLVEGARKFQDLDIQRVVSFSLFGLCYCGGFQPNVYKLFDRWFGTSGSLKKCVLPKMAADFFAYMPLVYVPSFYMITGMIQGLGFSGSVQRLCLKYRETLLAYFAIWLGPMFVYFRFIPEAQRVLYLSALGFVERCAISALAGR